MHWVDLGGRWYIIGVLSAHEVPDNSARARAEGLGISSKVGIAPRPERIIILGLGLLINVPTTIAALVVLAVLTHFTTMQRLFDVWHQTHTRTGDQPRPATKPSETPAP